MTPERCIATLVTALACAGCALAQPAAPATRHVPEAMQVRAELRAARAIGIHWGRSEDLTDEPADEPPLLLARQRAEQGLRVDEFDLMKIGQTRSLR